jgi:uroporphyrinogen-III synthase
MRVLVTREELVARVESLGHDAVFCELIRVEPLGDEPVDARAYDWLVVTSRNGAHELGRRGVTANRIAAIGPATAGALESHGLRVDLVATTMLMLGNSNLEEQDKPQLEMDLMG